MILTALEDALGEWTSARENHVNVFYLAMDLIYLFIFLLICLFSSATRFHFSFTYSEYSLPLFACLLMFACLFNV